MWVWGELASHTHCPSSQGWAFKCPMFCVYVCVYIWGGGGLSMLLGWVAFLILLYTWKKEQTKQTVDSCFRLVGPHQHHVAMPSCSVRA